MESVSYTHLDVYKRQLEFRDAGILVGTAVGIVAKGVIEHGSLLVQVHVVKQVLRGSVEFSGDVYKRQTLIIPQYARKVCSELYPNLYRDETAVRLIDEIDYDFSEAICRISSFTIYNLLSPTFAT